jgi:Uncharacterized protein conserved in bacteria (DUF2087)
MNRLDRMKVLAPRQHASLGVMASTSPGDFALLLGCAGCAFAPGETYSERDVNERLKTWLAGAGAMLSTDHVELRRWLVDNGVLVRDGYGRAYALGAPREEIASAMRELAGHDVDSLVREARERDLARRAERKARWQSGQQEPRG